MISHELLLVAVHAQALVVETPTDAEPSFARACSSVFDRVYTQADAWVTVNTRPAMVRLPVRTPPVLTPTVNPTEPFPDPIDPEVTVIHDALLTAPHGQPACVETATEPAPPAAATL
jgi:hypothetical protein